MTLLKNDRVIKKQLDNDNSNLTVKDGWLFGVGFGLAMTIAIPLILLLLACIVGIGMAILGSSIGILLGG